jgi:hypothetical protein
MYLSFESGQLHKYKFLHTHTHTHAPSKSFVLKEFLAVFITVSLEVPDFCNIYSPN